MSDISLIPKKEKTGGLPGIHSFKAPKIELDTWGKVGLVALVIFILAGTGLFIWNRSLRADENILQDELKTLRTERDAALEKEILQTSTLVSAFEGLLKDHRHWSEFFRVVEEQTVPEVTFTQFKASYETAQVALDGLAPNYKTLARQIKSLEEEENITRVDVSNIELNKEGEIEFSVNLIFKKELIKK